MTHMVVEGVLSKDSSKKPKYKFSSFHDDYERMKKSHIERLPN